MSIRNDRTPPFSLSGSNRLFIREGILQSCASGSSSHGKTQDIDGGDDVLRLDGRKSNHVRRWKTQFRRGESTSSCQVSLGSTEVLATVIGSIVPPSLGSLLSGSVNLSVSYLTPPPAPVSIFTSPLRISTVLSRLLGTSNSSSSSLLDLESLCITPDEYVWSLNVKVEIIDSQDGGNAIDASTLATIGALKFFRLPGTIFKGGDSSSSSSKKKGGPIVVSADDKEPSPLPLHHTPLTASFAIFTPQGSTSGFTTATASIADPNAAEEHTADGGVTVGFTSHGEMCLLDFVGGCELTNADLKQMVGSGKSIAQELCKQLETALEAADEKVRRERMARLVKGSKAEVFGAQLDYNQMVLPNDENENETSDVIEVSDIGSSASGGGGGLGAVAAAAEEEKYRRMALDYGIGHFAAKVKDKSGKASGNAKKQVGSVDAVGKGGLIDDMLKFARTEKKQGGGGGGWVLPVEEVVVVKKVKAKAKVKAPASKKKKRAGARAIDSDDEEEEEEEEEHEEEVVVIESEFGTTVVAIEEEVKGKAKVKAKLSKADDSSSEDEGEIDLSLAVKSNKKQKKQKK